MKIFILKSLQTRRKKKTVDGVSVIGQQKQNNMYLRILNDNFGGTATN